MRLRRQYSCARSSCSTSPRPLSSSMRTSTMGRSPEMPHAHNSAAARADSCSKDRAMRAARSRRTARWLAMRWNCCASLEVDSQDRAVAPRPALAPMVLVRSNAATSRYLSASAERLRTGAGHSGPERDAGGFARRDCSLGAAARSPDRARCPAVFDSGRASHDGNRIARLAAPAQKSRSVGLELQIADAPSPSRVLK